jgi:hypothetical protein
MYLNKSKKLLINAQLLKSDLLDLKKYSYFLKKNNYNFSFYNYKVIYQQFKLLVFLLKRVQSKKCTIVFMGLSKKDYVDYLSFNAILKKLVIRKGHIYADSKFNGFFYNRWSLHKRRSNPSKFFLNLQKNNKCPTILFSFSKETDNAVYREFSKFGIPIIYILEGYSHFEFKDYPLMGSYSREMLNFYLNLLHYCLK